MTIALAWINGTLGMVCLAIAVWGATWLVRRREVPHRAMGGLLLALLTLLFFYGAWSADSRVQYSSEQVRFVPFVSDKQLPLEE